jgi:hypothetical protein
VYHYSKLTCMAPLDLPGRTINVTLGDMGMTQMMGGSAPLGARMMLRAAPRTLAAAKVSLVAANMGWRNTRASDLAAHRRGISRPEGSRARRQGR